jgi:hypothetical protein
MGCMHSLFIAWLQSYVSIFISRPYVLFSFPLFTADFVRPGRERCRVKWANETEMEVSQVCSHASHPSATRQRNLCKLFSIECPVKSSTTTSSPIWINWIIDWSNQILISYWRSYGANTNCLKYTITQGRINVSRGPGHIIGAGPLDAPPPPKLPNGILDPKFSKI